MSAVDLNALVREWESVVSAKWREFREQQGVFISRHSPQWTMAHDLVCRQRASEETRKWTLKFFRDRGAQIGCSIAEDGAVEIFLPNDEQTN